MLTLTIPQARRFLLAQQFLSPPRSLNGKPGILALIQRLGCIQYDPVNIVGHNPELVLQARIAGYSPTMLDELLYTDRQLWDGWDKMMSIYAIQDWPRFSRWRAAIHSRYGGADQKPMQIADIVLQTIREHGPHSSIDIQYEGRADWFWGETRLVRATLESLYYTGKLGIHHRVGTRRIFDLIDRLLPTDVLTTPDPAPTLEDYQDWHILRRIGGLGLAHAGAGEHWGGIHQAKSPQRQAAIQRLLQRQEIHAVTISELPNRIFYLRTTDLPLLDAPACTEKRAAFLAPLDNLLWDRNRLRWLFSFDYIWEVYKPAIQRKYGHYTLPVLYDDHFIARFDPIFDRKNHRLTLQNWWWEDNIHPDAAMHAALSTALHEFAAYLNATEIALSPATVQNSTLAAILRH